MKNTTNLINPVISNTFFLLNDFMNEDPKKNPLFQIKSINLPQNHFINQLADKCPICVDKHKNPVKLENCIHIFCKKCIDGWIKQKKNCPICKTSSKKYLYLNTILNNK